MSKNKWAESKMDGQAASEVAGDAAPAAAVVAVVSRQLFRRKPLLVEAANHGVHWEVLEAGRKIQVSNEEFSLLYEAVDVSEHVVDAGLPDMEPGTEISKDGKRLIRVQVMSGRGGVAYWHDGKPKGQECGFRVVADGIDNHIASHRVGRFLTAFEGKVGERVWVVVG